MEVNCVEMGVDTSCVRKRDTPSCWTLLSFFFIFLSPAPSHSPVLASFNLGLVFQFIVSGMKVTNFNTGINIVVVWAEQKNANRSVLVGI